MAMLYPPSIDGKIPAQAEGKLKIPFRLNRSVSASQVKGVVARIKTISTSTWLNTLGLEAEDNFVPESNYYVAEFDIPKKKIKDETTGEMVETADLILDKGVYYKIQLAFRGQDDILGYYSTIGVFKYTTKPVVTILGLEDEDTGDIGNVYNYIGKYSQEGEDKDPTEKIYSYEFIVRDASGAITETSGVQIHDNTKDQETYESTDEFVLEKELREDTSYTIEYKITTMNGLVASTGQRWISDGVTLPLPDELYKANLIAENDYDNGIIKISIEFEDDIQYRQSANYKYILTRSSSKDEYSIWNTIMEFSVQANSVFPVNICEDFTIEQGEYYQYSLQMVNTASLRSDRLVSNIVLADFEDMFLYDGTRQLKIRFNPKVSSFKNTLLETKIDTLGGQYPFFFRNGNVQYKEMALSGLVSLLSDADAKFMSDDELGLVDKVPIRSRTPHDEAHEGRFKGNNEVIAAARRSVQLDAQNFAAERAFKLFTLDWLNNGQPKLFRSPAEGNYIVRLMNNSLSPNDTLSRMLHTFSSTAYEVAKATYRNMVDYGFVKNQAFDEKLFIVSQVFYSELANPLEQIQFTLDGGAYMVEFHNMKNNTKVDIKYANSASPKSIVIGPVGTYIAPVFDSPIQWVRITEAPYGFYANSYIEYGTYVDGDVVDFSEIHSIKYRRVLYQAVGKEDMIDAVENVKYKVGSIYHLRISTRSIKEVFKKADGKYYWDELSPSIIEPSIDSIYLDQYGNYLDYDSDSRSYVTIGTVAENYNPEYVYHIKYRGEDFYHSFDIATIGEVTFTDLANVEELIITNGLVADMYYQQLEITYGIELTDSALLNTAKDSDEYLTLLASKLEQN